MATALAPIPSYPGVFSTFKPFSQPHLKPLQLLLCADRRDMGEVNFPKHQHMEQAITLLEVQGYPVSILSRITTIPLTGKADVLASTEKEPQTQPLQV